MPNGAGSSKESEPPPSVPLAADGHGAPQIATVQLMTTTAPLADVGAAAATGGPEGLHHTHAELAGAQHQAVPPETAPGEVHAPVLPERVGHPPWLDRFCEFLRSREPPPVRIQVWKHVLLLAYGLGIPLPLSPTVASFAAGVRVTASTNMRGLRLQAREMMEQYGLHASEHLLLSRTLRCLEAFQEFSRKRLGSPRDAPYFCCYESSTLSISDDCRRVSTNSAAASNVALLSTRILSGRHLFSFRCVRSLRNSEGGGIFVGVCAAESAPDRRNIGWGIDPFAGEAIEIHGVDECAEGEDECTDGDNERNEDEISVRAACLGSQTSSPALRLTMEVDADSRTLHFSINGSRMFKTSRRLPFPLRACVGMYGGTSSVALTEHVCLYRDPHLRWRRFGVPRDGRAFRQHTPSNCIRIVHVSDNHTQVVRGDSSGQAAHVNAHDRAHPASGPVPAPSRGSTLKDAPTFDTGAVAVAEPVFRDGVHAFLVGFMPGDLQKLVRDVKARRRNEPAFCTDDLSNRRMADVPSSAGTDAGSLWIGVCASDLDHCILGPSYHGKDERSAAQHAGSSAGQLPHEALLPRVPRAPRFCDEPPPPMSMSDEHRALCSQSSPEIGGERGSRDAGLGDSSAPCAVALNLCTGDVVAFYQNREPKLLMALIPGQELLEHGMSVQLEVDVTHGVLRVRVEHGPVFSMQAQLPSGPLCLWVATQKVDCAASLLGYGEATFSSSPPAALGPCVRGRVDDSWSPVDAWASATTEDSRGLRACRCQRCISADLAQARLRARACSTEPTFPFSFPSASYSGTPVAPVGGGAASVNADLTSTSHDDSGGSQARCALGTVPTDAPASMRPPRAIRGLVPHQWQAQTRFADNERLEASALWYGLLGVFFCHGKQELAADLDNGVELPSASVGEYIGWAYGLYREDDSRVSEDSPAVQPEENNAASKSVAAKGTSSSTNAHRVRLQLVLGFATALEAARARAARLMLVPALSEQRIDEYLFWRQWSPYSQADRRMDTVRRSAATSDSRRGPDVGAVSAPAAARELQAAAARRAGKKRSNSPPCSHARESRPLTNMQPVHTSCGTTEATAEATSSDDDMLPEDTHGDTPLLPPSGRSIRAFAAAAGHSSRAQMPRCTSCLRPAPGLRFASGASTGVGPGTSRTCAACRASREPMSAMAQYWTEDRRISETAPNAAARSQPRRAPQPVQTQLSPIGRLLVGSPTPQHASFSWNVFDPLQLALTRGLTSPTMGHLGFQLCRLGVDGYAGALGSPILEHEVYSLCFRVDVAAGDVGDILVGVAEASGSCASAARVTGFAVHLGSGELRQLRGDDPVGHRVNLQQPLPALRGRATGALVTLLIDMPRNAMAVSVNGGLFCDTQIKLPPSIRPFASLSNEGDTISLYGTTMVMRPPQAVQPAVSYSPSRSVLMPYASATAAVGRHSAWSRNTPVTSVSEHKWPGLSATLRREISRLHQVLPEEEHIDPSTGSEGAVEELHADETKALLAVSIDISELRKWVQARIDFSSRVWLCFECLCINRSGASCSICGSSAASPSPGDEAHTRDAARGLLAQPPEGLPADLPEALLDPSAMLTCGAGKVADDGASQGTSPAAQSSSRHSATATGDAWNPIPLFSEPAADDQSEPPAGRGEAHEPSEDVMASELAQAVRGLQEGRRLSAATDFDGALRRFESSLTLLKSTMNTAHKRVAGNGRRSRSLQMRKAIDNEAQGMLLLEEQELLPELYCRKAWALLKLRRHEEALEAAREAASFEPLYGRTLCLSALALRGLRREEEAKVALARFDRLLQHELAVESQKPMLDAFVRFCRADPCSRQDPLPPARAQPLLGRPASFPPRSTAQRSLLVAALELADIRDELLRAISLRGKRAVGCTCHQLRLQVHASLRSPELSVRIEDATFENAAFVGRLPQLQVLHVQGEPTPLRVSNLRRMTRINISYLTLEAALFVGAILSGGEHTVRVSSGSCVALWPLRTRERLNLSSRDLKDADLAVLLGALALNRCLKELDLCDNPAPESNVLKTAMVAALPWTLLRHLLQPSLQTQHLTTTAKPWFATGAGRRTC